MTEKTYRNLYLALSGFVIVLLLIEIALTIDYKLRLRAAGNYVENNIFTKGRQLKKGYKRAREGASKSLWKEPLSKYRWSEYRPNASLAVKLPNGELYTVRINKHGYRTHDFSIPKKQNVLRIIAIGASTTIQGKTNETTYPAFLESTLSKLFPNKNIEVLNLGISGSRSSYWLQKFDTLLEFEPDLVIQYNGINDFAFEHLGMYLQENSSIKAYNQSHLYQYLELMHAQEFTPFFLKTLETFKQMRDRLAEHGIAYLVGSFAMPVYHQAHNDFQNYLDGDTLGWGRIIGLKYYKNLYRYMDAYNRFLKDYVLQEKLQHVLIHERLSQPKFFIDSCHMTGAGIRKLSHLFSQKVKEMIEKGSLTPEAVKGGIAYTVCNVPPIKVSSPIVKIVQVEKHKALLFHPPGQVLFSCPPGRYTLSLTFGISEGAYKEGKTDGSGLTVGINNGRLLFSRFLRPLTVKDDRGPQNALIEFDVDKASQLAIRSTVGQAGDGRWDWLWIRDVKLLLTP